MPKKTEHQIVAEVIGRCWTDAEYKAAVVKDPTGEFRKAGLPLGPDAIAHVHLSSLNNRHFIIPTPPIPPDFTPPIDTVPMLTEFTRGRPRPRPKPKKAAKKAAKKGGKARGKK